MLKNLYLECTCGDISADKNEELHKGARKVSYKNMCKLIKKFIPELYEYLCLDYFNPWHNDCVQTKEHYILVHSQIDYFIKKVK